MPKSTYPILERQSFLNLHVSAGFKPRCGIKKRSDRANRSRNSGTGYFKKSDSVNRSTSPESHAINIENTLIHMQLVKMEKKEGL
jgi:hypothetical protein